jgi:L-2-hydroxycarboxylate dehydrogenase (NAD+)
MAKVPLFELKQLIILFIQQTGFSSKESSLIAENFYEAEISGKKSHGLGNLFWFKRTVTVKGSSGYEVNTKDEPITITKETPISLHVDGKGKTGYLVIREALRLAFEKIKKSSVVLIGLHNTAPSTGYVGFWAKEATAKNLIYLSWNNSNGRDAPFGSAQKLYGTDPITVGIPTNDIPIILDMATSEITVGQLMNYQRDKRELPPKSAIDGKGNYTTDADIAWIEGALVPFGGYKGSGLMFIGEMLAGALTGSRVGYSVPGGWGTFIILFDPTIFRPLEDFKKNIDIAISELKNSKKREGITEIFYPGEKSQKIRRENIKKGYIEVDVNLIEKIKKEMGL